MLMNLLSILKRISHVVKRLRKLYEILLILFHLFMILISTKIMVFKKTKFLKQGMITWNYVSQIMEIYFTFPLQCFVMFVTFSVKSGETFTDISMFSGTVSQ